MIKSLLDSGSVVRYHCTLIDKKQTVDSHSWETAVILTRIYPECSKELLEFALLHDCGEVASGDAPAPIKKRYPSLKQTYDEIETIALNSMGVFQPDFTTEEKLALKWADYLSGLYFTTRRLRAGDQEAATIRDNWVIYLGSLPYLNDEALNIMEELL